MSTRRSKPLKCQNCVVNNNVCKACKDKIKRNFFTPKKTRTKPIADTQLRDSTFGLFDIVETSALGNCFYSSLTKMTLVKIDDEKVCR